jgi:anaerobic magnesium-protoporphyrin IX monomethyl ester cyclase
MAKILFINPVIREEDQPKHIPYGIALLAAIALQRGHQVQIYDANAWRKGFDVLEDVCAADEWDVIAIGSLTTAYTFIKSACEIARRVAPDSFIVAGGGFITSMPHEIMGWIPEIDLGVVGEAFITFPEVLQKIDQKDFDFSKTLGVCYRDQQGESQLTGIRPLISTLDVLPYPAWDLLPLEIYFKNSQMLYSEESYLCKRRIDINGSFGCSLVCKFCWHLGTTGDMTIGEDQQGKKAVRFSYGRSIRYHSPRYIVDMVKVLREKYKIDFVSFIDENLMTMDVASKRTWLYELCDLWIKEGLQPKSRRDGTPPQEGDGVYWSGTSHATLHRPETLARMYEAGCSHLVYGIESYDPVILKNLGKGTTVENNMSAVRICLESGIKPIPNIIIGFPQESFQSVRNTIVALQKLGIHAKPHFATPYPGSEWYFTYKDSIQAQYGGDLEAFIKDLGDASRPTAVISHKFSAMHLLGLQQIVMKRELRLLDQAEKHWANSDQSIRPVAVPQSSFNIIKKKVDAPIDTAGEESVAALSADDLSVAVQPLL